MSCCEEVGPVGDNEFLGGDPTSGTCAWAPESSLTLCHVRTQREDAVCDPESGTSPDTETADTLFSGSQLPELWEMNPAVYSLSALPARPTPHPASVYGILLSSPNGQR